MRILQLCGTLIVLTASAFFIFLLSEIASMKHSSGVLDRFLNLIQAAAAIPMFAVMLVFPVGALVLSSWALVSLLCHKSDRASSKDGPQGGGRA
jgi:hypothetical protein